MKIFSHDTAGGLFPTVEAALAMNPDTPEAALFSVLDRVEQYRDPDNSNLLHFKLCYPLLHNIPGLEASSPCNEWLQDRVINEPSQSCLKKALTKALSQSRIY